MGNEAFEDEDAESTNSGQEEDAVALPLTPTPPLAPQLAPAPIDQVATALGDDDAVALLKIASKYGIGHEDPMWSAVLILLGAKEAAQQAAAAAEKIGSAGKDLGATIFRETIAAGGELKETMDEAATKTATVIVQKLTDGIVKAIRKPFGEGVKAIETVIGSVDAHVEKERAVILSTWRKDLAAAAAREARRKSLVIAAVSWGTILLTCAACITIGAGVTWGVLDMTGHLLPWGYHLLVRPNGTPYCGAFHGAYVCGVTH